MEPYLIQQWEENKHKLEEYFRSTPQKEYSNDYTTIVKKVIEIAVPKKDSYFEWDLGKMVVIDHGDYQGTQLFIIPVQTYQPSIGEYMITHNYYGSCSGCDTLLSICDSGYYEDIPNDKQVKEYMTLSLHIVQNMKFLKDSD